MLQKVFRYILFKKNYNFEKIFGITEFEEWNETAICFEISGIHGFL